MKITIYELLGLIKDGKAPRQIKALNDVWTLEKAFGQYKNNRFRDLIREILGTYNDCSTGLTVNAMLEFTVEII